MRFIRIFGLSLFVGGILLFAGFGFYKFFEAKDVPLVIRIGSVGIILGIVLILVSLIKERIKESSKDQLGD